ncbi:unnamed protein product [Cunninghamella echinulata]
MPLSTSNDNNQAKKISISERRASYPLQERLKIYKPDTMARKFSDQEKNQSKLIMNGINILNKTSIDSDTLMHRIKQRRETHNRVERRRRDKLNNLVNELAQTLPSLNENGGEKCHRAKILRQAIDYIRFIQQENNSLKLRLDIPLTSNTSIISPQPPSSSSSITTTPEDEHHFTSESDTSSSDESHPSTTTSSKYTPPKFDTFCFQI